MPIFAVLLIAAAVVLGIYAAANGGSHDITIFGSSFHVYDWVAPVIAFGGVAVLMLLSMAWAMLRLGRLRRANLQLRADVERLRAELATARENRERDRVEPTAVATPAVAEREFVGRQPAPATAPAIGAEPVPPYAFGHPAAERRAGDTGDPVIASGPAHTRVPDGSVVDQRP